MSSNVRTFVFAATLCLICGILLTSASEGLKARKIENVILDKQKNILKALNLIQANQKMTRDNVIQTYNDNVQDMVVDKTGTLVAASGNDGLPVFVYKKEDTIKGYAMPFEAQGLWSLVKGFISLDGDGKTVKGFTVYSHGETPGLGGECDRPWFQNQFKNTIFLIFQK